MARRRPPDVTDLSRDELVDLATRLLARRPELGREVDAITEKRRGGPDGRAVRTRVDAIFAGAEDDDWRGSYGVADELRAIVTDAAKRLRAGAVERAVDALIALCAGVREGYESYGDEEYGVMTVLGEAGAALALALKSAKGELRVRILDAMVETVVWDHLSGGFGLDEVMSNALTFRTTADERVRLAAGVDAAMEPRTGAFALEKLGVFYLALVGAKLDDDVYLGVCERAGLHTDRVDRLLARGRVREAESVLVTLDAHDATDVADVFVAREHAGAATRVMTKMVAGAPAGRRTLVDWLLRAAEERSDNEEATRWALDLLSASPTVEAWKRFSLHATLVQRRRATRDLARRAAHDALVSIHTHDGDADAARQAWKKLGKLPHAALDLADLLAGTHAEDAVRLWDAHAESQIRDGGRPKYEQVAAVLKKAVRKLHAEGRDELGQQLVAKIRARYARRPALRAELNKARLPA